MFGSEIELAGAETSKTDSMSSTGSRIADDEESRVSEEGISQEEVKEQRKVEALAEKDERELIKKGKVDAEKIGREELLAKLRLTMEKSSMYATFMFDRLTQPGETEEKKKGRGRKKRKQQADSPKEVRKSRRLSTVNSSSTEPENPSSQEYVVTSEVSEKAVSAVNEDFNSCLPIFFTGGRLRPYQFTGLKWLESLHFNGINGILADEMGLGKTVQVIALICHLVDREIEGPYLVAGPLSTVYNWVSEFNRFAPEIPVVKFHGSREKRNALKYEMKRKTLKNGKKIWPVFVTSYEMLLYERKWFETYAWSYFVLDEGHRIKNTKCTLLESLKRMQLCNRLILTGTPLQNNLTELWSLLNFVLPQVFNNLEWFECFFDFSWIEDADKAEEAKTELIRQIHDVLNPFLLRRLKADVELDLPPKREILVYAPLTPWQQEMYTAAVNREILDFFGKGEKQKETLVKRRRSDRTDYSLFFNNKDNLEMYDVALQIENENADPAPSSTVATGENRTFYHPETNQRMFLSLNCIKSMMVTLRKITMHPYLLCCPVKTDNTIVADENIVKESGKMMVLDRLLISLKERGHKVLLFSQSTMMLDLIEEFCYLRNYQFCRLDGSRDLTDRQESIERFSSDENCFLFLISTRAGGLGINLVAADTVIIYDSDWNPQVDLQAQDRCHRIGQEKPVVTYRLTGRGTIDERIVRRATNKRRLEKMVIHSSQFKAKKQEDLDRISPEELLDLLKSTDYSETLEAAAEGSVISDEDLEKLLDRSWMVSKKGQWNEADNRKGEKKAFKVIGNENSENAF